MTPARQSSDRLVVVVAGAFFLYVAWIRTDGITTTFQCLADQVRDWRLTLGGWGVMPLAGPPSVAGGRSIGPIYYWFLWLTNQVIGPFTSHLPHAGGLGTALFQAVADSWLFVALSKRLPWGLALATALFIATAPFDVALSASIWNPPVSTAFVKITMALVLMGTATPSFSRAAVIAVVSWFAVQAHSTAIFVTGPLLAALVLQEFLARRFRRGLAICSIVVGVIGVLQVPFLIYHLQHPAEVLTPGKAVSALSAVSGDLIRGSLFSTIGRIAGAVQIVAFRPPAHAAFTIAVLAAIAIVMARYRRELPLVAITAVPFLCAVGLFLAWRARGLDDYLFETLTPAVLVCMAFAIAALPSRRLITVTGIALLGLLIVLQPLRYRQSKVSSRSPWYGPLIAGVRDVARTTTAIRDIKTRLPVDLSTDIWFLYQILGGHDDRQSDLIAIIGTAGTVEYQRVAK